MNMNLLHRGKLKAVFRDSLDMKSFISFPRVKVPNTVVGELLDVLDALGCGGGRFP